MWITGRLPCNVAWSNVSSVQTISSKLKTVKGIILYLHKYHTQNPELHKKTSSMPLAKLMNVWDECIFIFSQILLQSVTSLLSSLNIWETKPHFITERFCNGCNTQNAVIQICSQNSTTPCLMMETETFQRCSVLRMNLHDKIKDIKINYNPI